MEKCMEIRSRASATTIPRRCRAHAMLMNDILAAGNAVPATFAETAMPGAGTDKTKRWSIEPAPVVVLVEPQLGENIGAAARAMANFGLSRLRVVNPVQGWPNEKARVMAAGARSAVAGGEDYYRVGQHARVVH